MAKHQEQKRKKDLGIFYTPSEVVGFIFNILNIWKGKEEKETGRWESKKHYPSVIDPACGEGIFLKKSISSGLTKVPYIFGADIDIKAFECWPGISLSSEFKKSKAKMRNFFFHQDGLSILKPPNQKYHYRGVKKNDLTQFDAVIGNPPYGGIGIKHIEMISELFWEKRKNNIKKKKQVITNLFGENKEIEIIQNDEDEISIPQITKQQAEELKRLCRNLLNLDIWQNIKKNRGKLINHCKKINGVDFYINEVPDLDEVKRLKNFPIENLFINRFIQLAKPGGWIVIIIPDGVLTNSNSYFVREFIAEKTKVEAIVSLPRETFKQAGTSAKTSILFLRKLPPPVILSEAKNLNYPVFLASVEKINEDYFKKIAEFYQKPYNLRGETMNKTNLVQITNDQNGKEVVMVRADKTLKEILEEKPQSRFDVKYWHPKYDALIEDLKKSKFDIKPVGQFINLITYGSTKPRDYSSTPGEGVKYTRSVNVLFTGLNESDIHWIREGGRLDGDQYSVKFKDVVMNKCGTGTSGRSFCYLKTDKIVVSQHTMLIRLREIEPCYFVVYMNTIYGTSQFEKFDKGTSGQTHVDFEDIKAIQIPILSKKVQQNIESEYKKMSAFHDKAMEAKKDNDKIGYKNNIEIAEKMLKDLISKTEAVIRGERDDVI